MNTEASGMVVNQYYAIWISSPPRQLVSWNGHFLNKSDDTIDEHLPGSKSILEEVICKHSTHPSSMNVPHTSVHNMVHDQPIHPLSCTRNLVASLNAPSIGTEAHKMEEATSSAEFRPMPEPLNTLT
jgi:hypothetical protein